MKHVLVLGFVVALAGPALAGVIFNDSFDGYADQAAYETVWKVDALYPSAVLSTEQFHSAGQSIKTLNEASNKYFNYRDFGAELTPSDAEPLIAEFWMYDDLDATRQFNSIRDYPGTGYKQGGTTLNQMYAVGIYNNVTAPGEVHAANKYHARVTNGTNSGWFNLNAVGCPNRSTGWHKFTMEVKTSEVNFYVDDILGRTWTRGTVTSFDCATLGSILSSGTAGNGPVWTDDYRVEQTPEPAALALFALGGLLLRRR